MGLALASSAAPGYVEASDLPGMAQEYRIKAAILYNFTKFVRWPAERLTGPEIVLCILGSDPFGVVLDETVSGRTVHGKTFRVRRLRRAEDARLCHLVFLAHSRRDRLAQVEQKLAGTGVLIVSEARGFGRPHGMIKLVVVDRKVRFEIRAAAVENAGLEISSRLMRLAVRSEASAGAGKP